MSINLKEIFEKYGDEWDRFDRIETKFSKRPIINALILLDKIYPDNKNIGFYSTEGDVLINIDDEKLEEVATEQDIIDLMRCGIHYHGGYFFIT